MADAALDYLVTGDSTAAKRLASWRTGGSGRWPRNLDLEELEWSDWSPPEAQRQEEVELCKRLEEQLVRTGDFRRLTPEDGIGGGESLEHRVEDLAGTGRVDIVLVDVRQSSPTLVAIEVKLRALPSWNPVPQAQRYRACLEERDGARWRVRAVVVAEYFHDFVLDQALAADIEHRLCTRARGRLRTSL